MVKRRFAVKASSPGNTEQYHAYSTAQQDFFSFESVYSLILDTFEVLEEIQMISKKDLQSLSLRRKSQVASKNYAGVICINDNYTWFESSDDFINHSAYFCTSMLSVQVYAFFPWYHDGQFNLFCVKYIF